jgi:hypothetical protein
MLDNIYQIPLDQVAAVEWQNDALLFDLQLYELGEGRDEFYALTPNGALRAAWDHDLKYYVEEILDSRKCIVLTHKGQWIVKIFKAGWYPYHGYETVEIVKPQFIWAKNPEIDKLMTFVNDPFAVYIPNNWEKDYKLIWYIDSRFDPTDSKVWAMSVSPSGKEILGTKDMGYLTPDVSIEFNEHLPDLGIDADQCCPPFWELSNECAYELDPIHQTPELTERMWVIKFTPNWRKPKEWKWYGVITPQYHVIYNPELPNLDYELDYTIPWYDFKYEHVWMLDKKHLSNDEADIWAFTLHVTTDQVGSKIMDYISPIVNVDYNKALPKIKYNLDYVIPWHDLAYKHMWYLDNNDNKIWAVCMQAAIDPIGEKQVGIVNALTNTQLDVVFISYHELNAEANWQRLLEKVPNALRVDGVVGIFEAHKAAAKLAKTDMFFVVDADAYLTDDWQFDFQPGIFDRDCTYVWNSRNPVNDLTYGYGGVKLFNRSKVRSLKSWGTDLTLSVSKKLTVMDRVSNITQFNTSEYNTWKAAFRECAKLAKKTDSESAARLGSWLTPIETADFAIWAKRGAEQGIAFAKSNVDITQVNDYKWLKQQFINNYNSI